MRAYRESMKLAVLVAMFGTTLAPSTTIAGADRGYIYDPAGNLTSVVNLLTSNANCGQVGLACSGATPACVNGTCVQCSTNANCQSPTPVCSSNVCIQCAADPDCPAATPVCRYGQCVQCAEWTANKCVVPKPYCSPGPWVCAACTAATCGSASGLYCSSSDGLCKPFDNNNCGAEGTACGGSTPICRLGTCVQCTEGGAGCAPPTPLCSPGPWVCASCNTLGCPTGNVCNGDGSCRTSCEVPSKPILGVGACAGKCEPTWPPSGTGVCSTDCDCGNGSSYTYCDVRAHDCRGSILAESTPPPSQVVTYQSGPLDQYSPAVFTTLTGTTTIFSAVTTSAMNNVAIDYVWSYIYTGGPTQMDAVLVVLVDGVQVDRISPGSYNSSQSFRTNVSVTSGTHTVMLAGAGHLINGPPSSMTFRVSSVKVTLYRN
jgi:hypothetical protein